MGGKPSRGTPADMRLKANKPSKSAPSKKAAASKDPIQINPKNAGKLRAKAGVKPGQKIPLATLKKLAASSDSETREQATFAINARSFKH
jgi:hypothetical protein